MTIQNKKTNIKEELGRARECLRSAELLHSHGQTPDAVSRLYYYVFHAVKALLFSKGLEPKMHEGSARLLGLHFVKPGIVDPKASHVYSKLMKYREEADYNPSYVFTSDDYETFKSEAVRLENVINKFLKKEKLL
jgi:uncharacterized protein (UPF0332 family)